jgi:DNA (cytosine-5)-methyltransferase 1
MEKKPNVISLFSGAGGFDWGFHRAGFETRLACEKEKHPAATLAHNLKLITIAPSEVNSANSQNTMILGDICDVDYSQVAFEPDVVIGGPPCQDFSMAQGGERKGLDGDRGMLYLQFVRAMMSLQPKAFVFENVPGIKSANEKSAYEKILTHLQHLDTPDDYPEIEEMLSNYSFNMENIQGYHLIYEGIINATHLGVAQTRERVIIIGVRRDLFRRLPKENRQSIRSDLQRKVQGQDKLFNKYPMTCMEIFEGKPLLQLQERYEEVIKAYKSLALEANFPQAESWRENVWKDLTFDIVHDYYRANQIDYAAHDPEEFECAMDDHEKLLEHLGWLNKPISSTEFPDNSNKRLRQSTAVQQRMYMIPPDENHEFVNETQWHVSGNEISFIYRRPHPLKPAWTVMAYGGGGTYGYHYERDRAMLTLRERARIQTFTDDFEFKEFDVRAQIGEAVPPLMGEIIANEVLKLLSLLEE